MTVIKRWTITRSFAMDESLARWMAYDLAGQAFEIANCGVRIERITLEPGQENIRLASLLSVDDCHQAQRWGRLACIRAGLEGRTSCRAVSELKEIARDQEALSLGCERAAVLIERWWPSITTLADAILANGELGGDDVHAIIHPYVMGEAA
jgi:hypothetical protein